MSTPIPLGFSEPGTAQHPCTVGERVSFADIDAFRHVNHAVYLRWFENARWEYFRLVGINGHYQATDEGPILARIEVDYFAPVFFPGEVLISTKAIRIGNTSLQLESSIYSCTAKMVCATAQSYVVMVSYDNGSASEKVRVPDPIRAAIRAIDGVAVDTATG